MFHTTKVDLKIDEQGFIWWEAMNLKLTKYTIYQSLKLNWPTVYLIRKLMTASAIQHVASQAPSLDQPPESVLSVSLVQHYRCSLYASTLHPMMSLQPGVQCPCGWSLHLGPLVLLQSRWTHAPSWVQDQEGVDLWMCMCMLAVTSDTTTIPTILYFEAFCQVLVSNDYPP